MLRLFRNGSNFSLLLLLLISQLFWLHAFLDPAAPAGGNAPVYAALRTALEQYPFWATAVGFVLVFFGAVFINNLAQEYNLVPRNSFVTALLFISLASVFPFLTGFTPAVLVNLLLIPALLMLFRAYHTENASREIFNAAFLTGLSVLILPAVMFFLLLTWATLIIYRIGNIRLWAISLIGFCLPAVYYIAWLYLTDKFPGALQVYLSFFSSLRPSLATTASIPEIITLSLLAVISLLSVTNLIGRINDKVISLRKMLGIVVWMLVIGLLMTVTGLPVWQQILPLLFLPLSVSWAHYYHGMRKPAVMEFAYLAVLFMIVFLRFFIEK